MKYRSKIQHQLTLLLCLCILTIDCLHAQRNKYTYDLVTTKEGLSSLKIYSIAQDNNGFLWIGTMDGLNRYDGYNFKVYRNIPDDPNSIPVSRIMDILVAPNNILWLTTKNEGLIKFDPTKEEFTHFINLPSDTSSLPYNDIWELYMDNNSTLWGTTDTLIGFYMTPDDKFIVSDMPPDYISQVKIYHHIKDLINGIYNITCTIDRMRFTKTLQGNYIIGTMNNGAYIYITKTNRIFRLSEIDFKGIDSEIAVCEDQTGVIWIGKSNVGIFKLSPHKTNFVNYNITTLKNFKLQSLYVRSLLMDKNGTYWIGTNDNGLIKYNKDSNIQFHFKNTPENKKSLPNNNVRYVFNDSEDNIWVGLRGFLSKLNSDRNNFTNYPVFDEDSSSKHARIYHITEDDNNNLWISNWDNLIKFNKQSKQFKYFSKNLFEMDNIRHVLIDHRGQLWISAEYGGIVVFNLDSEKIAKRYDTQNGLSNSGAFQVFQENQNTFWASTLSGLNKIDIKRGKIDIFTTEDGLPSNIVMGLIKDKNQDFWITTANGLAHFNREINEINSYFEDDGLQHNEFVEGAHYNNVSTGHIMIGGIKGFNVFHPDSIYTDTNKPQIAFTKLKINNIEVIPNKEVNDRIILQKPIEYTNEIKLYHRKDKVLTFEFSALHFNSQDKNKYAYKLKGYDKDFMYTTYKHRSATYTNLDPGVYTLKVIASNNSNVWNTEGKSLKITITPAFYQTVVFRIGLLLLIVGLTISYYFHRINTIRNQKLVLEEVVRERTTSLMETNTILEESKEEIEAQKDMLYDQNIELENHKQNLESLVHERTKEFEKAKNKAEESDRLKSAFLANMSHEIRTPMNSIIGFSSLLENDELTSDERIHFVNIINKSGSSLLNLIDDILDFSKIDSNQVSVKPTKFKLNSLLDEVNQTFLQEYYISKKNIKYTYIPPEQDIVVSTDYQRCRQVISNLLTNANKFTKEGSITLKVYISEQTKLVFSVKDTGIGISTENQDKIFERFNKIEEDISTLYGGVGLGLTISKQLAKLLGGDISINSELGKGSEFSFWIPIKAESVDSAESKLTESKIYNDSNLKDKHILILL